MKLLLLMIVLAAAACEREPKASPAPSEATDLVLPADDRKTQPAKVVPKPNDPSELDRMILAGFTPHADHLHPPGVKSCPLAQGNEAVM
ncbi:MAG TPA: hypothetical protein VNA29_04705 [Sphingomicrobium sp.]|nr:hypothetical protein [Sphingomicrobium sp.]